MRYDISKSKAPAMPNLGKGTECIRLLLSQVSKDNYEPFVPMFFPIFGAHISGAEFQYPDNSWKELTGMMANLVANSGDNKGQLAPLVEAICRDFRQHDMEEEKKYQAWQRLENSKGNNKDKPLEPIIAYDGTSAQLRQWLCRKFIEYSAQTGLYTKTEEYLGASLVNSEKRRVNSYGKV